GRWRIDLPAMSAADQPGPLTLTVSSTAPGETLTIHDVVLGELWLASGQSNMARRIDQLARPDELKQLDVPADLRLFTVERAASAVPIDGVSGAWQPATPKNVRAFSATAYYFGRELCGQLDVPVGLICSAWGGTGVESWTPEDYLTRTDPGRLHLKRHQINLRSGPHLTRQYEIAMERWQDRGGRRPEPPPLDNHRHAPANLYNGMIHPLTPLSLAGVIWYQGEHNAAAGRDYRQLFPAMIHAWRDRFDQPGLPFYFVQLANYQDDRDHPVDQPWSHLREAQLLTYRTVKNTGMAVAIDIGEADDIHPRNKLDVGLRLARWALRNDYGQTAVVPAGPLFRSADFRDGKAYIDFDFADAGLAVRDGQPVAEIAIAGADKKFVWAQAEIRGGRLIVWSDRVPRPTAVRYAWASNPADANLVNAQGLPASPFRTDP
ncbi:MAG: sialate O-acetylesterase, partial [Planctomycetota bacterium]